MKSAQMAMAKRNTSMIFAITMMTIILSIILSLFLARTIMTSLMNGSTPEQRFLEEKAVTNAEPELQKSDVPLQYQENSDISQIANALTISSGELTKITWLLKELTDSKKGDT